VFLPQPLGKRKRAERNGAGAITFLITSIYLIIMNLFVSDNADPRIR